VPLSATAAVGAALDRTRRVLFEPFDAVKWLKLGFCAFLARLGEGSFSGNVSAGDWGNLDLEETGQWAAENVAVLVLIAVPLVLIALLVWAVLLWVRSRGRFMFLDGVARDRGAVIEPWTEYRTEGNSLFAFTAVVQLGLFLFICAWVGVCLLIAWPDLAMERFEAAAAAGVILAVLPLIGVGVGLLLMEVLLEDFVVPAMHARRVRTLEGWRIVVREVVGPHPGEVFLYLVLRVALVVAVIVLVLLLVCGTLCCAACFLALPYVGTLLMLPVLVFLRCFPLCFLEQLGGPWKHFTWPVQPVHPPPL